MATEKQNAANAENAQKSTGPRTEEGKKQSRRNACKYGITGLGIVRPEHLESEVIQVYATIYPHFKPRDAFEEYIVKNIAHQLVSAEESVRQEIAQRNVIALRAEICWDDDRKVLAAEDFEALAKKPIAAVRRLTSSMHGCAMLIEEWQAFDEALATRGEWAPEMRAAALDMLGISAARRSGPTVLDVPDGANAVEYLRAIVRGEIERLEARRLDLVEIDEVERYRALEGGHDPHDPEVRKFQRYTGSALGTIARLQKQYRMVDRLGQVWVKPTVPRQWEDEPYEDFQKRMNVFRAEVKKQNEKMCEENLQMRIRDREEDTRARMEDQPAFHDGLDFPTFLARLQDWHYKRTGQRVNAVVVPEAAVEQPPAPPQDGPSILDEPMVEGPLVNLFTKFVDALTMSPGEFEAAYERPWDKAPASDPASPPTDAPATDAADRHNR